MTTTTRLSEFDTTKLVAKASRSREVATGVLTGVIALAIAGLILAAVTIKSCTYLIK